MRYGVVSFRSFERAGEDATEWLREHENVDPINLVVGVDTDGCHTIYLLYVEDNEPTDPIARQATEEAWRGGR